MFAYNFLRTIDFAALLGIYPVLSGDGRAAPVSNEDMARVVAVLLAEGPDKHAGRGYRPTGPQLLSAREMARGKRCPNGRINQWPGRSTLSQRWKGLTGRLKWRLKPEPA